MTDLWKLSEEGKIEEIVRHLKKLKSNEEQFEIMRQLPDKTKIALLGRLNEILIAPFYANGFAIRSRDDVFIDYKYLLIDTLEDKYVLKYLKGIDDSEKKAYFLRKSRKDDIKLKAIPMFEDLSNKIMVAITLKNENIRDKVLKQIGVNDTLFDIIDGTYELSDIKSQKYKKIGIPENMTFGIEIEGVNYDYADVLKLIKQIPGSLFEWDCKGDYTISLKKPHKNNVGYGIECSSPVFEDNEKSIQQIYTICNIFQKLGTTTNSHCGGHIHIGRSYFEKPQEVYNLYKIYGSCTEILNLILNKPGQLPRDSLQLYARSGYRVLEKSYLDPDSYDDAEQFMQAIAFEQGGKEYDVNISTYHPTIEFRSPNGNVDPDVWIENIRLVARLMETAKALEDEKDKEGSSKQEIFSKIQVEKDEKKKCALLLDMLFDDENEREVYEKRYTENRKLQFEVEEFKKLSDKDKKQGEEKRRTKKNKAER